MSSAVDICNLALANLGADGVVAAIDPPDGSVEAGHCARFYPMARCMALEYYNWAFARTRVQLAAVTNPSSVWQYAYAVPAGCLTARRVLSLQNIPAEISVFPFGWDTYYNWTMLDALFDERGSVDFELEDGVLLTNEPEAVLLYTRDITDTSKFTPTFTVGLGMMLAGMLAGPIIKGRDSIQIGDAWVQRAQRTLDRAIATDANASAETADFVPQSIKVRA